MNNLLCPLCNILSTDKSHIFIYNYRMSKHFFNPTEVIFSASDACNLLCPHCYVSRTPNKLSSEAAIAFLRSCKESSICNIDKIGFSGGEPFLYMDFLCTVIKAAVQMDFMFDQIMTNGDWWKDESDLANKLQQLFDAGYDGKFGLSWDIFHGQTRDRMETFAAAVHEIYGPDSLIIQSVIPYDEGESLPLAHTRKHRLRLLTTPSSRRLKASAKTESSKVEPEIAIARNAQQDFHIDNIPLYQLPQSFPGDDKRIWQSKKWFKEDYCEGPGQILYIHSNGNIAPCCGFANENPALFIGTIKDNFETVMEKADSNKMIKICYEKGLSKYRKQIKKMLHSQGKKIPGKCSDICGFCDFVMKNLNQPQ